MNDFGEREMRTEVHLVIILTYTLFSLALIGESILLGWPLWPIFLIVLGIVSMWFMHITGAMNESYRVRVYAVFMLVEFFYYGTFETSYFDLALVIGLGIVLFALAGEAVLISCSVLTYFAVFIYQLMSIGTEKFFGTPLDTSRTLLHFTSVIVSLVLSRFLIRRRKRDQESYERILRRLETTNSQAEDFLTNISHELRTPINAVTGITNVMIKNERDSDKRQELMSVRSAGQRLFDQIGDILDYTEIDTDRLIVSEDTYMLSSIINDLLNEAKLYDAGDMPELVFDIDPHIPMLLAGDARKIKKILKHLIDNGLKFTKKGGVCAKIYSINKPYGINLVMEIKDTGSGISAEELTRITGGYYQSDTSRTRRTGGLGLGLAIVRGFAASMGGFMQIESREGIETVVRVSVPQRVVDAKNCMEVAHPARLCMAVYLRPEKYETPAVREFYNDMIGSLVKGLNVAIYRANAFEELKKINDSYHLTHLFLAEEEYAENPTYYESLEREVLVVVIADPDFKPADNSRVLILKKPFYPFSIVNVLDSTSDDIIAKNIDEERMMIAPGVEVLVVDDERMNLIVAEGIFKDYRMKVTTATGGYEAIALCEKQHFDIIFLDHMMPEMDGVETFKRLIKLYGEEERPRIVALTANAVSGAREMFLEEGFDEFVPKPVETGEMERVLKKILPSTAITYVSETGEYASSADALMYDDGSELSSLRIAGVNVSSGLRYSRDDEDFYYELLKNFVYEQPEKTKRLDEYYNAANWKDYRILVHGLKSTSKMIGLDELSEEALQQEEAAKNLDEAFIKMSHTPLMEHYKKYADIIKKSVSIDENDAADGREEISLSELCDGLKALKECFETFEVDKAEGIVNELSKYSFENESVGTLTKELSAFMNDFDLESAAAEVDNILKDIQEVRR